MSIMWRTPTRLALTIFWLLTISFVLESLYLMGL